MNSWEAAFAKVSRRGLFDTIDAVDVEPPFRFSFLDAASAIPDLVAVQFPEAKPPCEIVIDLADRDVSLVNDALFCVVKFLHVVQCGRSNARRGALTWSVVDGYHASLLGARALCALMGVIPYTISGRSVLVDFRPEFGTPQDMIKFRKAHGRREFPISILAPKPALLEQATTWKLLVRLMRFASFSVEKPAIEAIVRSAEASPGRARHAVIYDSLGWIWRSDSSSLSQETMKASAITDALTVDGHGVELLDALFDLVQQCAQRLSARIGLNGTALPDSILLAPSPYILAA